MKDIHELLRTLGITCRYKGYKYLCHSICLILEDESRLEAITKEIYMPTARYFGCRWTTVERHMRTLAARAWRINAAQLSRIAGYPLRHIPTPAEFLEIVSTHFLRNN